MNRLMKTNRGARAAVGRPRLSTASAASAITTRLNDPKAVYLRADQFGAHADGRVTTAVRYRPRSIRPNPMHMKREISGRLLAYLCRLGTKCVLRRCSCHPSCAWAGKRLCLLFVGWFGSRRFVCFLALCFLLLEVTFEQLGNEICTKLPFRIGTSTGLSGSCELGRQELWEQFWRLWTCQILDCAMRGQAMFMH